MKTTAISAVLAPLIVTGMAVWAKSSVAADNPAPALPVTAIVPRDTSLASMEKAVQPEVLEAFKQAHPAPFWLFGEDRQFAVRNNIVPARWFENAAGQYGRFSGVACPGEFYVFQLGVLDGNQPLENIAPVVKIAGLKETRIITRGPLSVKAGEVKPLWIGVQVPKNAKAGEYRGTVQTGPAALDVRLRVAGEPLEGDGTLAAWRLARLKWLDSTIAGSDTAVTAPFTPVVVNQGKRQLDILGRRIVLGENGIPAQYTSFYSTSNTKILEAGRAAFAAPPRFECIAGGTAVEWKPKKFKFTRQTPVGVEWIATSVADNLLLTVSGRLEYDGNLQLKMKLAASGRQAVGNVKLDDIRFVAPWNREVVKYSMGLGMQGGRCPDSYDWKWNPAKHHDAVWLGDVNLGVMLRFKGGNFERPLVNAYYDFKPLQRPDSWGTGGITIAKVDNAARLTASSGPQEITGGGAGTPASLDFDLDWYFTPFKPLDANKHFTDRYYHVQRFGGMTPAELRTNGVNILNIHQGGALNPYINYPYNDDTIGPLRDLAQKCHAAGVRLKVYYTTRELTQNLPEFFALKSLDGEVIIRRRAGVGWPITNSQGPHPWLAQHAGLDIVPAWREDLGGGRMDLAVITTPDSRWNNFYLEGLDYLVKQVGIDGVYIDDTALDRKSMQRARRILDSDGNPGRRIDMHSWNHFNGLARDANSSIVFMELYPYYDRLWHGEGFSMNNSPEYILVEMSGIPYGLMSEMLEGVNPYRGMVFGMTSRWTWSGDPRNIWKVMDLFGIVGSEYIGWWDPACPVKPDSEQIKVSVYRKQNKTMIALASWASQTLNVKLAIDWKALGLDPQKARLRAPAVANFQPESVFGANDPILVEPGKGWLLIVAD